MTGIGLLNRAADADAPKCSGSLKYINNMETKKQTQSKPRKRRGWATYEGDEFSFRPCEEGTPSQLNVKTCKGGKTYETTSEKKPQRVAHLTCPMDAADPWHEYTSQLRKLGIKPQKAEQDMPDSLRVVKENGLQVWLDEKKAELTVTSRLDLSSHFRDWQAELLRQVQLLVRRLPASDNFNKVINIIKKERR